MAKKTLRISLAMHLNERYDHRCAIGIIKYARTKTDWNLLGHESRFFTEPRRDNDVPDGIIARIVSRQELTRLMALRIPVVDIAGSYLTPRLRLAVNDDHQTGVVAARHFLARGFQHFASVVINDMLWSQKRHEGFAAEVAAQLGADVQRFVMGASWNRRKCNLSRLVKWLRRLPQPCAVMAANDLIGYRITVAATAAGLAVPGQVAIIGVDNEDLYCELAQPQLTTIACDCERIGFEAARLLDRILTDGDRHGHAVIPPGGIEPRESTNIVIGEDGLMRDIKNYIRANIKNRINVADVASHFPLSRRALERRFRASEGKTIHDVIVESRLERACRLLAEGKNVTEAGYESGFVSIQHFHHTFKKRYKQTPLHYALEAKRKAPPALC